MKILAWSSAVFVVGAFVAFVYLAFDDQYGVKGFERLAMDRLAERNVE